MEKVRHRVVSLPATIIGVPGAMIEAVRMKKTDENLDNKFGHHVWSNEDLDPVK
jgi:NCS1 family nucleobase:cation symporter-1